MRPTPMEFPHCLAVSVTMVGFQSFSFDFVLLSTSFLVVVSVSLAVIGQNLLSLFAILKGSLLW